MIEAHCGTYCEHNADKVCDCQPCAFIRDNGGYVHVPGCPQVLLEVMRTREGGWFVDDLMEASRKGPGTLYVALAALERTGQVTSDWEDPEGPSPRRRVYSAVARGN